MTAVRCSCASRISVGNEIQPNSSAKVFSIVVASRKSARQASAFA